MQSLTDISPEALNTQNTINISNDSQEEGRRGPWPWKGLMQHSKALPGQRSGRGLIEEWVEGRGLMGLMGRGNWERENHMECKQRV